MRKASPAEDLSAKKGIVIQHGEQAEIAHYLR